MLLSAPRASHPRRAVVAAAGLAPVLMLSAASCGGAAGGSTTAARTTATSTPRPVTGTPAARSTRAPASQRAATSRRSSRPAAPVAGSCASARSGSATAGGATYLLAVPPQAATATVPLVLDFHGYQQSAAAQEAYTGLGAYGAAHGVAVATVDGAGGAWNFPRSPALRDDVAVSRAVVADVRSRLCGHVSGVGAAGWSDGGDMAALVACTGVARAAFVVAPSITPRGCASWPAMAEVHGTADPFVPYDGGGGSRPGPFAGTEAQSAVSRVTTWAARAGCSGPPRTYHVGTDVGARRWDTCDVRLYSVEGGGHTWPSRPGSDPVPGLGRTTTTLDGDALAVDFLTGHRR